MREAAEAAANASSVAFWSTTQLLDRLSHAIEKLNAGAPGLPVRLKGNLLHHPSADPIELTDLEVRFLNLMIRNLGQPVSQTTLAASGIMYPAKVKSLLLDKLEKAGIELRFDSPVGYYVLHPE